MTPVNAHILVKFDPIPEVSGIAVPERYLIQEADEEGENNAYGVSTNRKLINPQVVTILSGENKGKRAFVYYGAYEIAKWPEPELALIPEATLLFFLDPIAPLPGTYLGDEVFTEGERTASGIYITPYAEKKEGLMIKITHIPETKGVRYGDKLIQPGDTVVTVDSYQYDLRYENKKYIKLKDTEIVGVKTETGFVPTGDRVLIEYLPEEGLAERNAENDKRKHMLEVAAKHHLHIGDMPDEQLPEHLKPIREPNFTAAKVISGGNGKMADTVMVFRNYGCILPNGQWITNADNIVGVIE